MFLLFFAHGFGAYVYLTGSKRIGKFLLDDRKKRFMD